MKYRDRCYQAYTNSRWRQTHALGKGEYDFFARAAEKRYRGLLPENKDARILDVACGTGHFLYALQKQGYRNASGIDISEDQLAIARTMGVDHVQRADCFAYLSRGAGPFDMILANDLLEHLSKDEVVEMLDAIHRSLVQRGRILVGVPNVLSFFGCGLIHTDFTHEQGFTPESLGQVLRVCRFEDIRVFGEKPVMLDIRSGLRAGLWWCLKGIGTVILDIEHGRGRGFWRKEHMLEPRIFAVGTKT